MLVIISLQQPIGCFSELDEVNQGSRGRRDDDKIEAHLGEGSALCLFLPIIVQSLLVVFVLYCFCRLSCLCIASQCSTACTLSNSCRSP